MSEAINDPFDMYSKTSTSSLDSTLRALDRRLTMVEYRERTYQYLDEITPNFGLINGEGEIRFGNSVEPGEGFTGIRMGYPAFEYVGGEWHIVGVNNDNLMVGLSATDGKFYAAGGSYVLDQDGATRTGINFFDRWNGENAGISRRLEEGMFLNGSTPAGYIWFGDPTVTTNLQINADFELGNLDDFDAADSASPFWAASTASPYAGAYSALLTTSAASEASSLVYNGDLNGFTGWSTTASGSSSWTPGTETIAAIWVTGAGSETATLATASSGYYARVTASANYTVRIGNALQITSGSPALNNASLDVNWYDSSGAFISTSTVTFAIGTEPTSMQEDTGSVTAPGSAFYASYTLSLSRTSASGVANVRINHITMYLDSSNLQTNGDFETGGFSGWTTATVGGVWTVAAAPNPHGGRYCAFLANLGSGDTGSLTTNLGGTPRMAVTAGLYYNLQVWATTTGTVTLSTKTLSIKWYTATSGGSLIDTTTITINVPSFDIWYFQNIVALAPPTAAGAEIVISIAANGGAGGIFFDDITFSKAQYGTLTTNLGGTPKMAVTAGESYQASIQSKTDLSTVGVWKLVQVEVKFYDGTGGGAALVGTTTLPLTFGTAYANTATPIVAPPTAAGATIVLTAIRDGSVSYDVPALGYFDDISLRLLTVSRYIKFLPNVTFEGGPVDFALLGAAAITPTAGILSVYGLSADKNLYAKNSDGGLNVLTPFQAVANPSSAASVDFQNIPQTGHDLIIRGKIRPATNDVGLYVRINNHSAGTDYAWTVTGNDPSTDLSDGQIKLVTGVTGNQGVNNSTVGTVDFEIVIINYAAVIGSTATTVMGRTTYRRASDGLAVHTDCAAECAFSEAVTRVTILFESGNIAEGTVRLFIE